MPPLILLAIYGLSTPKTANGAPYARRSWASEDDEIAWWEQTDTGWTKHTISDSFNGASAVTAQDMDRDGDLDVAATAKNSDEVSWWEQTDTGWVKHVLATDLPDADCVVIADIDQDLQTEVIAAGATTATGQKLLAIYSYTDNWVSTPDYGTEYVLATDMDFAQCAHFADVDGDGDLDIIAGYEGEIDGNTRDILVWFENDGGDFSGWASHIIDYYGTTWLYWLNSIGTGDIDGDGDLDIIITDAYADFVKLYENEAGDGSTWTERYVATNVEFVYGPTAVDMDGDGDLDIVVCYSSWDADDGSWQSGWWENVNGDGTVWQEVIVEDTTGWSPASLYGDVYVPVDLDGDGDLDLVVGREGADSGNIQFWEYRVDASGTKWVQHILQDDVFGCEYLAVADMDNDSDLDIVGVANGDGLVAWWENDGDYESTWTMHLIAEGLDSPGNLYVADFDLDGDMDVAAVSQEEPGALAWWQNVDGEGDSWTQYTIVENLPYNSIYNGGAAEIAGGDLDGDGRPELLVVGHISMHLFFSTPIPPRCDQGTVRVCVSGIDDNPTGGDGEVTTDEDVDYTFAETDFTFNDVDNHTFSGIRIESLETEGTLEYEGSDVEIGDIITDLTKLIFSPDSDENGTPYATFTFTVMDSSGAYSDYTYTMTVNVNPANEEPIANPQTVSAEEDVPIEITLTGDDGDADATQILTYFLDDLPDNGALYATLADALAGTNALTAGLITGSMVWYVTDSNDPADTTFTFHVQDDGGTENGGDDTSTSATVTVNVTAVNDTPVANPQTVNALEDVPIEITLTGDDGDPDATQTLTYFLDDLPDNGALYATLADALAGTNALTAGSITGSTVWYVTDSNDPADTSFTFHVQDDGGTANGGQDTSTSVTVTLNVTAVNDTPVANPQTVNALEDVPIEITLTGHDGDADAMQTLTYFLDDLPVNGALYATQADAIAGENALTAGSITGSTVWYVTDSNDPADTSFTFHVQDDGGTANDGQDTSTSVTVTLNVTAVNDTPVANPQTVNAEEDVPIEITLTGDDGDPDATQTLTYFLDDLPVNGALYATQADALAGTNALTAGSIAGSTVWYVTDSNDPADTNFTFHVQDDGGTANDGQDTSTSATVAINVTAVNDTPVANPQTVNALEDVPIEITLTGDDGDPDATQTLTYFLDDLPDNGALYATQADALAGENALTAGSITGSTVWYVTDSNDPGDTSFTFHVQDDGGTANDGQDTSTSATVTVNVTAVNDEPAYSGPTAATTDEDVPVEIGPFTGADGDPEVDQSLTYWLKATGDLANGDLYRTAADVAARENPIDLAGADVEITWGTSVWYMSDQDTHGDTSFQIYVTDDGGSDNGGDGTSADYTVNITVESVNDAPVVKAPGGVEVNENSSVHITGISVFDVDLVQDPSLELSMTLNVANGTLTLGQTADLTWDPGTNGSASITITGTQDDINAALATLSYTPNANFHGADTLQIIVNDLGNSGKSGPIVVSQAVPIRVPDLVDFIRPDEADFAYPGPSGDFIPTVGRPVDLGKLSSFFSSGEGLPDYPSSTEATERIPTKSGVWPPLPPPGDISSFQDHDNSGQQSDVSLGLHDFMALLKHWGYADNFDDIRLVFNEGIIHLFELLIAQNETAAEPDGENVTGLHGFPDLLAGGKSLAFNLDELRLADLLLPPQVDLGLDALSGQVQPTEQATVQVYDFSDLHLAETLAR